MIKKIIANALITMIGITAVSAQEIHLSGYVSNPNGGYVYLQKYINKSFFTIDSVEIKDGQFDFQKRSDLKLPEIYGLSYTSSTANPFDSYIIFLDQGDIRVKLDSIAQYKHTTVSGSKEHDHFLQLQRQHKDIVTLIQENPKSLAALYILYRYHSFRITPERLRKALDYVDSQFKGTEYVTVLEKLATTLQKVNIGESFPNFTAFDKELKEVKASSLIGKGYVLFDFWASWCPPCRAENPNLVKAYTKYKDKGFSIVSISLDNDLQRWEKAYTKDHLQWLQLVDQKAWAGDGVVQLGIRLIPANFLISPEGKIIAHNLKGNDLDLFLNELFK